MRRSQELGKGPSGEMLDLIYSCSLLGIGTREERKSLITWCVDEHVAGGGGIALLCDVACLCAEYGGAGGEDMGRIVSAMEQCLKHDDELEVGELEGLVKAVSKYECMCTCMCTYMWMCTCMCMCMWSGCVCGVDVDVCACMLLFTFVFFVGGISATHEQPCL